MKKISTTVEKPTVTDQRQALNARLLPKLALMIFNGFGDEDLAFFFKIPLEKMKRIRNGQDLPSVRLAVLERKQACIEKIKANRYGANSGLIWFLERRWPKQFAKAESLLNALAAGSTTNNTLVVSSEIAEKMVKRMSSVNQDMEKLLKTKEDLLKTPEEP